MKFNFSLRGRQSADARYAYVRTGTPDVRENFYQHVLAASLTSDIDPTGPLSEEGMAIRKAIKASDPDGIARLAIHLSEERDFRATAIWLTAELAAVAGNEEETGLLVQRIVRQPMDIPLWLQYFHRAAGVGVKPGRAVRKQLNNLFHRLDEYSFARYSRETQTAVRATLQTLRPKAADKTRKNLFAKIVRDQLPVRSNWEQEWHALHHQHYDSPEQRQVALRDKWKEGISSFRIGYAPLLDNLRPMLCAGVSGKVLKLAAEYLGNAAAVSRSRTTPLRLLEVSRNLRQLDQGGAGMLAEALEQAVPHSTWARSDFGREGSSVIAMDVSNSMKRPVEGYAAAQRFDVAPLLAMLMKNRGDRVITGVIGNTWRPMELRPQSILLSVDAFRAHEGEAGYAINAWLVLQDLLRKKQAVDRVLLFTDCRLWDNRGFNQPADADLSHWWRQYRNQVAPNARLYLFDLAGYGARALECLEDDVFLIAGWKEGITEILHAMENVHE